MKLANVTLDTADPAKLAEFWSAATGQPIEQSSEFFAILKPSDQGVRMLFLKVPESKTAKNRMHVDFHAPDREVEVERLVAFGATRHDTHNQFGLDWTVLTDPEGNEFCVAKE